jgi:hypothetical protein
MKEQGPTRAPEGSGARRRSGSELTHEEFPVDGSILAGIPEGRGRRRGWSEFSAKDFRAHANGLAIGAKAPRAPKPPGRGLF